MIDTRVICLHLKDKDELLLVHPNSSDLRTTTGEVIRTKDYNQPYNSIVVSPDGRFLIRIAMNGKKIVW